MLFYALYVWIKSIYGVVVFMKILRFECLNSFSFSCHTSMKSENDAKNTKTLPEAVVFVRVIF